MLAMQQRAHGVTFRSSFTDRGDIWMIEFDSPGKMEYVSSQPFWFGKCMTLEIITAKVSPRHVSRLS